MAITLTKAPPAPLALRAGTAADLMSVSPVSIRDTATVAEAVALLTDKGFSAAPVIDEAGRPVGVVSRTDILVHDREKADYLAPALDFDAYAEATTDGKHAVPHGFQVHNVDPTLVRDIMTPAVFRVSPHTPARQVVSDMLGLNVHRLFVVDENGILVGVVTSLDVLRHLKS